MAVFRESKCYYDPLYEQVIIDESLSEDFSERNFFAFGLSSNNKKSKKKARLMPLLESYELNRLNFVRQSGLAFLSFPSSTHTRFAHSLGSAYLGSLSARLIRIILKEQTDKPVSNELLLSEWMDELTWRDEFIASLLLHDCGHFAFSHTVEHNFDLWNWYGNHIKHEDVACEMINGKGKIFTAFKKRQEMSGDSEDTDRYISSIIEKDHNFDKNVICYLINKNYLPTKKYKNSKDLKIIQELVSGILDIDRMDHYRRDCYFTGIGNANFNFYGLLSGLKIHSEGYEPLYKLSDTGVSHALALLESKERLKRDFFENIESIAFNSMLNYAIYRYAESTFSKNKSEVIRFLLSVDDELLFELKNSQDIIVKNITTRILNKKPYHFVERFYIKPIKRLSNTFSKMKKDFFESLSRENIEEGEVLIHTTKDFGKPDEPSDDWLALERLLDDDGKEIKDSTKYRKTFNYLKECSIRNDNDIWVFVSRKEIIDQVKESVNKFFS